MTSEEPRDQPKSSGLNFTLPDLAPAKKPPSALTTQQFLIAIVALLALNLILTLASRPASGERSGPKATLGPASLDADALKQLALKLEQQGLAQAAADAWREYLTAAAPDAKEAASIWYRIGKAHQDARS
jgi:hypothetical protein